MALGDSYCTLAELKAHLGGIAGSSSDTRLTEIAAAASRGVEEICGRQFNKESAASARLYYPTRRGVVEVDDFYTTTDLVIKTDGGSDGTYDTTWATADYELEPLNGIVDGETGWPYSVITTVRSLSFPLWTRRAPLEVTAKWGWNAVPARVKEATLMGAEEIWKLKDAPFGVAGFAEYGVVRVRENPFICNLLKKYRRTPVLVG